MIRIATYEDYKRVVQSLNSGSKLDYITSRQARQDFEQASLYIVESNQKVMAIFSLVYDEERKIDYLKRLKVLNKRNLGLGFGTMIVEYVSQLNQKIAVTPWIDNKRMRNLLERNGFKMEYIFNEKWCYYTKNT